MSYETFVNLVVDLSLSLRQLRCDVPPTQEVLDLIGEVGDNYETYVLRLVEETAEEMHWEAQSLDQAESGEALEQLRDVGY